MIVFAFKCNIILLYYLLNNEVYIYMSILNSYM